MKNTTIFRGIILIKEQHSPNNITSTLQTDKTIRALLDSSPLCVNILNDSLQNIACNKRAMELFGVDSEIEYLKVFNHFTPKLQPNGAPSVEVAAEHIKVARETGFVKFPWLHISLKGEEIPCELILTTLDIIDQNGKPLFASYIRDLRPELAGNETNNELDTYFFDYVTDKTLFNTITDFSEECFFYIDYRAASIQFYGKGFDLFDLPGKKLPFPDGILSSNVIYEQDLESFKGLTTSIVRGVNLNFDVRCNLKTGVTRYYRISYKTVFSNDSLPLYTIGKFFDVHEQKSLEILSQTDQLTNCYNKVTAENLIKETISHSPDASHALFIVDIDNFKAINDNLGHHFGDLVLSEIASNLHSHFRSVDIIGRIGGDEFIVFVKNIRDIKIITARAEAIAEAFKNTYSGEFNEYKVSGSIGVALFNKDGKTYEELYKAADKALYQSKLRGKDCYTFYTNKLSDGTMKNRTVLENADRIANSYFDTQLVSTVFDFLHNSSDANAAIASVLRYIGRRTNSDRSYIFETFDGGLTYDNTYEWCKEGIGAEIHNLQGIPASMLADFFEDADGEGVLYSNDLTVLDTEGAYDLMADQGILSFLHAQTFEKDYVKLFLGLDDCTNTRVWTPKDINSLVYAAKMISIFLASHKKRK